MRYPQRESMDFGSQRSECAVDAHPPLKEKERHPSRAKLCRAALQVSR